MSHKRIRVKLIILPHNETLCILAKPTNNVNELQGAIHSTLAQYSTYQILLKSCKLVLELRVNGKDVAISGYYLLHELLKDKSDIIAVKLVHSSQCNFQRLQPRAIALSSIAACNTQLQNKSSESKTDAFDTSNIFELMTRTGMADKNNKNNNDNAYNQHIAILNKFKAFCVEWLKVRGDHITPLLLNELSQVLEASFPDVTRYLKASFMTTPQLFWHDSLFIELGLKHALDPHIRFSINYAERSYNIKWENYLVFDAENSTKLWNEVKSTFIHNQNLWNAYGFGFLPKQYFVESKFQWTACHIRTVNGQNLVEHPRWKALIAGLRNARLNFYSYNSNQLAAKLVQREAFQNSIHKITVQGSEDYVYSIIVDTWLRFCLELKIVPTALLKYWMTVSSQAFMRKQEFNQFIKLITDLPARHPTKWITQRYEYALESMNDKSVQLSTPKYAIYCKSRDIYNQYLQQHPEYKRLNGSLCDQIIELCLNDSVQGIYAYAIHDVAEIFEHQLVDKVRCITSCVNNTRCGNERITMLDEKQQMSFWKSLRLQYSYHANEAQRGTPDILLNEPLLINNQKIYWIDAKYWYVSRSSKMLFKGFVNSVKKYTNAHGTGAVVCNGFEQNTHQWSSIQHCNVTLLDGSRNQTQLLLKRLLDMNLII